MIENALSAHPAVALAAAIGKPDAYAGELPVAYVELHPSAVAPSADELIAFARDRISSVRRYRKTLFSCRVFRSRRSAKCISRPFGSTSRGAWPRKSCVRSWIGTTLCRSPCCRTRCMDSRSSRGSQVRLQWPSATNLPGFRYGIVSRLSKRITPDARYYAARNIGRFQQQLGLKLDSADPVAGIGVLRQLYDLKLSIFPEPGIYHGGSGLAG